MNKTPTISVVIATYNSKNTIKLVLNSVRKQNYPQEKIEIIIADGGSKDNTLEIVIDYNVKIIKVPPDLQNAEYNKGLGISKAKNELLLLIDHDNVLPHKNLISKMVQPFLDDKKITGVETLRYHYDKNGILLDRYFALFGAGDPLAYYLGKADRLSYIYDKYNLAGKVVSEGEYITVEFDKKRIPTLGANGFMIRRKLLLENAKADPKHYFHIDVNVDLIKKGFNRYAFIKDGIIHLTGYKSTLNFIYRRALYMQQYHINLHSKRRYSVYMKGDLKRLLVYIFYSLTFVKPFYDSLRGYLKIHDKAWFLHPILCFTLTCIYSSITIRNKIFNNG